MRIRIKFNINIEKDDIKSLYILNERKEEVTMDTIGSDNKRTYTVVAKDAKGRPAPVDGVPVWTVLPTGVVSLFPTPDGLACEVMWIGPGTCVLTVKADADVGTGVKTISTTADITTTPSPAATLELAVGPEVPQ